MLTDRISILAVSPAEEDHRSLRSIFRRCNWTLFAMSTIAEALSTLDRHTVPVVICAPDLSDGNWKDLMTAVSGSRNSPRVVVMSDLPDERLWSEVLHLGGYDVLMKPFHASEVFHVLSLAARGWRGQNCQKLAA